MNPIPAAVRVGTPLRHEALSLFPLYFDHTPGDDYFLGDEALAGGWITVSEISESGSVPELLVENRADRRVLFIEGEELIGARQNRVLNTSVLVGAHSSARIPVSCVEQGRWSYNSRAFRSGGTHASPLLRKHLKKSVSDSVLEDRGHQSDQHAVWREVARKETALASASPTHAYHALYASSRLPWRSIERNSPTRRARAEWPSPWATA